MNPQAAEFKPSRFRFDASAPAFIPSNAFKGEEQSALSRTMSWAERARMASIDPPSSLTATKNERRPVTSDEQEVVRKSKAGRPRTVKQQPEKRPRNRRPKTAVEPNKPVKSLEQVLRPTAMGAWAHRGKLNNKLKLDIIDVGESLPGAVVGESHSDSIEVDTPVQQKSALVDRTVLHNEQTDSFQDIHPPDADFKSTPPPAQAPTAQSELDNTLLPPTPTNVFVESPVLVSVPNSAVVSGELKTTEATVADSELEVTQETTKPLLNIRRLGAWGTQIPSSKLQPNLTLSGLDKLSASVPKPTQLPTKAKYSYAVSQMLELRDSCVKLLDPQGMPEWALLRDVRLNTKAGIGSLLEYGKTQSKVVDVKYQLPQALTRKTTYPDTFDWNRKKKEDNAESKDQQIVTTKDSWLAQQKRDKEQGDRGVKVIRQLRAQLNKMTPKTYDAIFAAILDIGIENVTEAEHFVNLIFEKAITNHNYIEMYADLCRNLELELHDRGVFKTKSHSNAETTDFKKLLIQQCQKTFRNYLLNDFIAPEGVDDETEFELLVKHKNKMKGNLMFVACLASTQLIQTRVLLHILNETLLTRKPLQLEALASFLPSCAPAIANTKKASAFIHYLEQCSEVTRDETIDQRTRFLLTDAIEQIEQMNLLKESDKNSLDYYSSSRPN